MSRSSTIIRELALNLANVIFTLKHSVKNVVICYAVVWQHYTPVCAWVFQVLSLPQVSPPKPWLCMDCFIVTCIDANGFAHHKISKSVVCVCVCVCVCEFGKARLAVGVIFSNILLLAVFFSRVCVDHSMKMEHPMIPCSYF